VGKREEKLVIGILGGIASGKSTVAAELAKLGCKIIDADRIAHEALCRQDIRQKVTDLFGEGILDSSGKINRKELANLVFADADKLSSLNKIIHPLVLKRAEELVEQYSRQRQVRATVLDMPLLLEASWAKRCDKLIFVRCKRPLRLQRAKKMGFDENQIKIRENFQISLDNKAAIADNVIDNNSNLSTLVRQVADIFSNMVNNG
jgi:dephospho-CoA kinase